VVSLPNTENHFAGFGVILNSRLNEKKDSKYRTFLFCSNANFFCKGNTARNVKNIRSIQGIIGDTI